MLEFSLDKVLAGLDLTYEQASRRVQPGQACFDAISLSPQL